MSTITVSQLIEQLKMLDSSKAICRGTDLMDWVIRDISVKDFGHGMKLILCAEYGDDDKNKCTTVGKLLDRLLKIKLHSKMKVYYSSFSDCFLRSVSSVTESGDAVILH